MFTRVFLFVVTNLSVVLLLTLVARLLGLGNSPELPSLLVFASLIGFGGSFISLLLSKSSAKASTRAYIIQQPRNETERWLINTIERLSQTAGIGMPEVGIYEGAPNAFATGASRDNALVCVSTGLMSSMTQDEIEAVLGHEISHVANGDMVTMTLLQGVVNTFVVFISRLAASLLAGGRGNNQSAGGVYFLTATVAQLVLGLFASIIVCYYSRRREYRADAGSAYLLGQPTKMIAALRRLEQIQAGELPQGMKTFGITDKPATFAALFSTHPPLEDRVLSLEEGRVPPGLRGL